MGFVSSSAMASHERPRWLALDHCGHRAGSRDFPVDPWCEL